MPSLAAISVRSNRSTHQTRSGNTPCSSSVLTQRAFFDFLAEVAATPELLVQTAQNPVVRLLDEVTARATTTIYEGARNRSAVAGPVGTQSDEVSMVQFGVYYDDVSKSTGQWLFTHRRMVQFYIEHDTLRGDVTTPRSRLFGPSTG